MQMNKNDAPYFELGLIALVYQISRDSSVVGSLF